LPEQPIFFPVLDFGYTEQLTRDPNRRAGPSRVARFEAEDDYAVRFEGHVQWSRRLVPPVRYLPGNNAYNNA
jgi:hypothetical protein